MSAQSVIAPFTAAVLDAIAAHEAAHGRPLGDVTAGAILRDAIRRMGDAIAPISFLPAPAGDTPAASPPCAAGVTAGASSDAPAL